MLRTARRWGIVALVALAALHFAPTHAHAYWPVVTGYLPSGNLTATETVPDSSQMACSHAYPFGTVIEFWDGTQRQCTDDGYLDANGVTFDFLVYSMSEANYVGARYSGQPFTVLCWGYC